ncbi:GAP family protein [Microbacterium sp. ASV49]|uniref:GAP family protein n=1 Tax=Microbacterium candidum TaxID=3041922 RepID=A0ABT7N2R2_9MICO|nr:GAP family protein [Microbacterium sp. ASV49]MDL9980994.1 GAP family protein [Microbacterium sp. ASV49]
MAVGIAISPIPIIATILLLLSPRAGRTSTAFLLGWILGITISVVVFTLLGAVIPVADPSASQPIAGTIRIVLGVVLLLLAVRQWRSRPKGDEPATLPAWLSAIDSLTVGRAIVLAFLFVAINPKNIVLASGAGITIGAAELTIAATVIAIVVFVIISAASVAIPVIGYFVARDAMSGPLDSLREWLVRNNATIMAVLLLVIGVVLIGEGLQSF